MRGSARANRISTVRLQRCGSTSADERDIITDKESGKDFNRPGYQYLREVLLRPGDTLIVKSLDRLGRNKQQVKQELEYYKAMGVRVKIIDLPSTMADFPKGQEWICEMVNNIMIEVLATSQSRSA